MDLSGNKMVETKTLETVSFTEPEYDQPTNRRWNAIKSQFLAKAPLQGAPLVYGGHRVAEEPEKLSPFGILKKFAAFVGPGFILAITFNDPDNYLDAVQSGENFVYKQLFMIFVSICIAVYLQYLCLKLGTVTGLDLAQMNHKHLPRWLELSIYAIAETVIICTDISAVIGAAFAWNILIPKLPLAAACVITTLDCLIVLAFYSPRGTLRSIRAFELFMTGLLFVMVITVAIALGQVHPPARQVFKGFLPSREIFAGQGLYTTCTMIGGMLMPHTFYVGSAIARPRLLEYDQKSDLTTYKPGKEPIEIFYRPSLRAIKSTLRYAGWELGIAIFAISMFINCGLEIIGGAALAGTSFNEPSDLYALLQSSLNTSAAKAFAVSLLFSGIAAGTVSTMAGQIVMEGAFQVKINPIVRRLVTRLIAIIPALIVCVSVGENGIASALTAINYILAIGLIFTLPPVVWYVTQDKYMSVPNDDGTGTVGLKLGLVSTIIAWLVWALVLFTTVATIVLLGLNLTN